MIIKTDDTKVKRFIGAFLLFLIISGQKQILGNEQQESIPLDWKKDKRSSHWTAEVNRFDVPSGEVVEVKGPPNGLIRVTGEKPTSIMGTLISSNPIYIINPYGVVVGPKANINDKLKTNDINKNSPKTKLNNNKNEENEKYMERAWKMAYDFVSGPGIDSPPGIQITSASVPVDSQWLNDYIWLGDIRIGGISERKETKNSQKSQDELIQSEIERVKIQKFTTPTESLGGEEGGFIEMREGAGYDPVDNRYIPQRCGSVILLPKVEKH